MLRLCALAQYPESTSESDERDGRMIKTKVTLTKLENRNAAPRGSVFAAVSKTQLRNTRRRRRERAGRNEAGWWRRERTRGNETHDGRWCRERASGNEAGRWRRERTRGNETHDGRWRRERTGRNEAGRWRGKRTSGNEAGRRCWERPGRNCIRCAGRNDKQRKNYNFKDIQLARTHGKTPLAEAIRPTTLQGKSTPIGL